MVNFSTWRLTLLATSLIGAINANPTPDGTRSSPAVSSVSPQPGCPSAIGLKNGDFESGKIAPWTLLSNSNPTTKQRIVSPGYKGSKYALQVDFVAANLTEYDLEQLSTGKVCYGYYYNISYAWNWVKYAGPEGPGDSYCAFSVYTGYTQDNVPLHYGSRKPGWHFNSYIAQDIYSDCRPAIAAFIADVTCVGQNETKVLPPFSIQIDNLNIRNAPKPPTPPPSGDC